MAKSLFKPTRSEVQRNRTHEAWREIVETEARERDEKLARLAQARAERDARIAAEEASAPAATTTKAAKPRRKKQAPAS